jgi:hypothetical protein
VVARNLAERGEARQTAASKGWRRAAKFYKIETIKRDKCSLFKAIDPD